MSLHLRYDQLILVGVAGVIGVTVVFAFGVERGKQLARAEQSVVLSAVAAHPTEPWHPPQGGWAKEVSRDVVSRLRHAWGHEPLRLA